MDTATPRTEALDCPEPKYAQEIQFDGSRYFAIVPEDYEQFYESHLKLERELIASAERVARLEAALNKIASWEEGEVVDGSFDDPFSAEIARQALGSGK